MDSKPIQILLIEDNPGDVRLLREMLAEAGGAQWRVQSADRLSTGVERLRAEGENLDLVLLDLGLPDSQGLDTFTRVYAYAPQLPIVLLTGRDDQELAAAALRSGAQDYLVKGQVDAGALLRALRHAVERKRTEELDEFFDLSLDMLCIAGFDGYFKRLNPAWEKTLGFTIEELLAKPYVEFIHPDDRESTLAEAQKLTTGADVISFENRYRCQDGSYRWLLWKSSPLLDRRLVYAAARDITERKRAEELTHKLHRELERRTQDLEAINRELEAFTYSVSHDLRAPLRHVDGFAKILLEEAAAQLNPGARHSLERIREGTRHMGQLVDDLLNLARVGRTKPAYQVTGLNSLVEEALDGVKPETQGRQVEWKVAELPFADCDPNLIKQVFANLLSNAVKFTRPRDRAVIEVGTLTQNGRPVIFVRDNGVGFSMKYADKLFGVFQRLHRQEDFEGTGVGLATVQRIIHKHGGRVWAEAELNQGATFYFTLAVPESGLAEANPVEGGGA